MTRLLLTLILCLLPFNVTAQDVEPYEFIVLDRYIQPDNPVALLIWTLEVPFGPVDTVAWQRIGSHTWLGGLAMADTLGEWHGNVAVVWNMRTECNCGDLNGDGGWTFDISDLTFGIDFMFNGGPPPECEE